MNEAIIEVKNVIKGEMIVPAKVAGTVDPEAREDIDRMKEELAQKADKFDEEEIEMRVGEKTAIAAHKEDITLSAKEIKIGKALSLNRKQGSAIGSSSIALGNTTEATGTNSAAIGSTAKALGAAAMAFGYSVIADTKQFVCGVFNKACEMVF